MFIALDMEKQLLIHLNARAIAGVFCL